MVLLALVHASVLRGQKRFTILCNWQLIGRS